MSKYNIVIIEDIKQMITLYEYCLKDDFDIHAASNFQDITKIENKEDMDVVILDFHIPGEDFDNILDYVKKEFPKAKRVIISGHTNALELEKKYQSDVLKVFQKPLKDYNELKDYLLCLLKDNIPSEALEVNNSISITSKEVVDTEEDIKETLLSANNSNKDDKNEEEKVTEKKQEKEPSRKSLLSGISNIFKR